MDGVNRVWKVVQQYNGQSIIPIIILIGILFLVVREKKNTNYLIVYLGVLLLTFNEVTYYLIRKLGEGMTYYRFLWMIPMVIISAYVIMKLFETIDSRKRKVFAAGICALCDIGNQHATIFSISGEYLSNATEYGRRMRYY
jgi:hypothetical protein